MNETVIKAENIAKQYKLGVISAKTLKDEFAGISARIRGKENPNAKIGVNSKKGVFNALEDVSFEIYKGETVGIIGRNGAGKSTLLKVLSKITTPTDGKAYIKGRISSMLEIGTGFHPELTGRENIYLNGAVMGFDHKYMDAHFEEILEFSELRDFIDVPVKNYSSGMIARLGFSIATITKPDILIVDEVLAVGDENFQKKCINKIHSLLENNTTLLFVSHNSDTVQEICNRAIWLDGGKLMIDADSKTACDAYRGI